MLLEAKVKYNGNHYFAGQTVRGSKFKKNIFKIKVGHIGYLMMNLLNLFLTMVKVEMNGLK